MRAFNVILSFAFIYSLSAFAQKTEILTLDRAIQIGLENSYEMNQAKSLLQQYQHDLKAWKLQYSSNANIEVAAPMYTNRFREVPDPATGKIHIVREDYVSYRSSLIINQPISFTDGTLSFQNSLYNLRQHGEITYQSDIVLNYNQPLFKISTRKINLKRAEYYLKRTKINYYRQKRELKYNITERFLNLLGAKKNIEIAHDALKRAQVAWDLAQAKYRTGLYSEMDLLKSEVDALNEQNNLNAQEEIYDQLLEQFKLYIGLKRADTIDIAHSLAIDSIQITESELLKQAIQNYPDRLLNEIDIKLSELEIKYEKAQRQFTIDLNLQYGFSQIKDNLRDLFGQPEMTQIANIGVFIPLWDCGQNKESVLAAKEELVSSQLMLNQSNEALKVEIKTILLSLNTSHRSLTLAEQAESKAQKSYEYSLLQFNAGTITSDELSLARQRLNRASLNALNAKIKYLLAIEMIKKHLTKMDT